MVERKEMRERRKKKKEAEMRDKRKERRDRATIFPSVGKVADEGKGRGERRDKGGE